MNGFRILSVPNPTNWRAVPLSEFDLELNKQGEPLVGICGDTGSAICLQYREGIIEYDHIPTAESLNEWYKSHWMGQTLDDVKAGALRYSQRESSGVRLKLLEGLEGLDTALDVGAGYGDQVKSLQRIASKVTVIEPCAVRAQALREVYGCETLHGSFPDVKCKADLIVCHHVIEHVRDAEQVFAAFAECQDVGGRLVITCPNFMGEPKMGVCLFLPHLRSFTRGGLINLAARFGYRLELDLSKESELNMRFVKSADASTQPDYSTLQFIVGYLLAGLGLGGSRVLFWEKSFDGAIHVNPHHLQAKHQHGGVERCVLIADLHKRKTNCPIEIQWAGETQVFVK